MRFKISSKLSAILIMLHCVHPFDNILITSRTRNAVLLHEVEQWER